MRENRTYGSEGGEAKSLPYPYRQLVEQRSAPQYAPPQLAASSRSSVSSRIAASASMGSPNAKPWAYSHPN